MESPADSKGPVDAKVFRERFAAYWLLEGRDSIWWRVAPVGSVENPNSVRKAVTAFRAALLDGRHFPKPVELTDPPATIDD
jgi:hypothetical protein